MQQVFSDIFYCVFLYLCAMMGNQRIYIYICIVWVCAILESIFSIYMSSLWCQVLEQTDLYQQCLSFSHPTWVCSHFPSPARVDCDYIFFIYQSKWARALTTCILYSSSQRVWEDVLVIVPICVCGSEALTALTGIANLVILHVMFPS